MHIPEEFSVSDLSALLAIVSEREMDEFNTIYDQLEQAKLENITLTEANILLRTKLGDEITEKESLLKAYNDMDAAFDVIQENTEKQHQLIKQSVREKEQAHDKFDQVNVTLKAYKEIGTPKKIRERIKAYQKSVTEGTSNLLKSKELIKGYRSEITRHVELQEKYKLSDMQSNMTTVWSENGDSLLLFPAKLTMDINGMPERQLTLLFMTGSGCAKLIGLTEEGEPAVCTMPKGGLKPKARTLEVAGSMLRKWRRQDWKVTASDLNLAEK